MYTSGGVKLISIITNVSWPTFHGSLTLQIFCEVFAQKPLNWVIHTSWRVKLNSIVNIEYSPTFYGSPWTLGQRAQNHHWCCLLADILCFTYYQVKFLFFGMIKARLSAFQMDHYIVLKCRQARHSIPWNSCLWLADLSFSCSYFIVLMLILLI